jgi:integrase
MPATKLRQDTVRTLPYLGRGDKHQCVYWDEAFESFGVRVYPSGRRTYVCSYRINRRKRLAKLGRVDAITLDQARRKAQSYLGRVANNEDPQSALDALKSAPTVAQLAKAYVEGHARPKKKSWRGDESILRRNLLREFGTRPAHQLTSAELTAVHVRIGAKHPCAANELLNVVRKMYNWGKAPARMIGKDVENPAVGIQHFPKRRRRRFITTVEMPRFIVALEREDSEYARHGIWMLLLTGLRMREMLRARWSDVDWEMGTLFIGLTKNGEPLLAPLSDAALARLKVIPRIAGNPYIICGHKPGDCFKNLGPALKRVRLRAGLENLRVHDLRRTVGSWLAQGGTSLHLIGDVLNHQDPSTTAGYAYFQTQHRREALSGHADKVLALAPHLRPAPSMVSAESLLPAPEASADSAVNCPPATQRHYFRREALYELVWTAPVLEVAGRLNVSDVALAKLCRRAAIPIPPRGYWARLESGQAVQRPALPAAPAGLAELLWIRGKKTVGMTMTSAAV